MSKLIFRHGDVLLVECDLPIDAKVTENKMLKAGEESNHGHFISGEGIEVLEKEDEMFVKVDGNNCSIRHLLIDAMTTKQEVWTGEHTDIKLPKGKTFKVIGQVEYDPYADEIRRVQD